MNIGAPWPSLFEAERRVLGMQTKLHQWATADPDRCFDDLFNLVHDPAFLVVAWSRVRGNKGARTAGVDGIAPRSVVFGAGDLLDGLRGDLKAHRFVPQRVREKTIPKAGGKVRKLGIPTVADRVVQAALKLVLEPIFEADFKPCSYGFRPKRRAQDAIAEIHHLASPNRSYEWVFEADITACFDEIDHTALMGQVRDRIGDKRVLSLVSAFLRAGVLSEEGIFRETDTGTPQGGILSPLLANIALSIVDEHFARKWEALGSPSSRDRRRRAGVPMMRLVRYADDFVVMISGQRADAEALWDEVGEVLAPMGLRLSEAKTKVSHIDDGFDFLGWRIQRRPRPSRTGKTAIYTYPSKKSLASVMDKVRTQDAGLDEDFTITEIVGLYQGLYPRSFEVDAIIEQVGLTDKRDARVKTLSGGQRRRLDLALGLIGDPSLLFLDEPTTGFDPSARRRAWELIEGLRSLGTTVLLTTHYMEEAEHLADRVAIIVQGRLIALGTPAELGAGRQDAVVTFRLPPGVGLADLPVFDEKPVAEGVEWQLTTAQPTAVLHTLTGWALRRDVEMPALTVRRPSLEDVYLELVSEQMAPEAVEPSGAWDTG